MSKIPMLEKFAAQSLVEHDGELIFSKEKFAELIIEECCKEIMYSSVGHEDSVFAYEYINHLRTKFGVKL